jgi:hypothetical protein
MDSSFLGTLPPTKTIWKGLTVKTRTEVFLQLILPGDRDSNLEEADRIASMLLDNTESLAVSVKLEQVDNDGN